MAPKAWLLVASCIFLTAWPNEATPAQVNQDLPSRIPNLAGYDSETRQTMELACIRDKASGPVAYSACLRKQIEGLSTVPRSQ